MASVTALTTQLIWGLMECLVYKAIEEASGGNLPMNYSSIVTYFWLRESLWALFNTWAADNDLFAMIENGDIAYEMCRPLSIYSMWFSRTIGARIAEAIMRCVPVLFVELFYDFTAGMENGIDRSGRFSVRKYYTSAIFPKKYLFLLELSPFAYMQNVPFRIYSGDLAGGKKSCTARRLTL